MRPEDVADGPLLLDTDVFSWRWEARGRHADFEPFLAGRALLVSVVTVAEAWHGALKDGWGARRRKNLELRIAEMTVLTLDIRVALKWSELYSELRGRLSGDKEAHDLWIAACALVYGLPLVTNNLNDFRKIAARFPLQLVHPDL